jgi:hypothetical protein
MQLASLDKNPTPTPDLDGMASRRQKQLVTLPMPSSVAEVLDMGTDSHPSQNSIGRSVQQG